MLRLILALLKPFSWKLFFMQLSFFAMVIDLTIIPYFLGKILDVTGACQPQTAESYHLLMVPVMCFFGAYVVSEILFRVGGFLYAYIFPRIDGSVRIHFFDNIQNQHYLFFKNHLPGHIFSKFQDLPLAFHRLLYKFITLIIPTILCISLTTMYFLNIHFILGILIIVYVLIHFSCLMLSVKFLERKSFHHAVSKNKLESFSLDVFLNHIVWRTFVKQKYERYLLRSHQLTEQQHHTESLLSIEKTKTIMGFFCLLIACVGVNGMGIYYWYHEGLSVGDLAILFQTTTNVIMLMWWISMDMPCIIKDIGICHQALQLFDNDSYPIEVKNNQCLMVTSGAIRFEDICFGFQQHKLLFNHLNIDIKAKEKIGIVGFSGSGKSTLMNLLLGLYPLQEGRILIDGCDLSTYDVDSVRHFMAFIPQQPMLFNRSILDNICYGDTSIEESTVHYYAKLAQIHDFIQQLPNGYYTIIGGEDGIHLSGGQMQRLSIARALIKNASIYIWDEATSALDTITEKAIQSIFSKHLQNATVIVIAHRLSTVQFMDRIIVLDQGRIVEEGNHEDLLNNKGTYYKLWNHTA
jgi:ATP-binding cassette subfamily B protein